jgi:hypothetical protein
MFDKNALNFGFESNLLLKYSGDPTEFMGMYINFLRCTCLFLLCILIYLGHAVA